MERRKFFTYLGVGAAAVVSANLVNACTKDNSDTTGSTGTLTIDLTDSSYSSLTTPGNSVIKNNMIIIHTSDGNYVALSKICTHEGCTVGFDGTKLVCPCHGAKFTTTGAVISGPTSVALKKYNVSLSGNVLTITA